MFHIDRDSYQSQTGVNTRLRFLILHFTTLDFAQSVAALTHGGVSSHYLIPDQNDPSYTAAGFTDMRIFQLVDENLRAWHAGESYWGGRIYLNDSAIGIEIVNNGFGQPPQFHFPAFPPEQIAATIQLCRDIVTRYPDIAPTHVLGHSDIAVGRKFDPGAAFPWFELYQAGIGAWFDEADVRQFYRQFSQRMPDTAAIVAQFARYGYDTRYAHTPAGYRDLVQAFQLHFRPSNYDGVADAETVAILYALMQKYAA